MYMFQNLKVGDKVEFCQPKGELVETVIKKMTDEDGNPYQYSGHWSWIYFDNNECYDENGVNAWTWLGQQAKVAAVEDAKKDETSKGNQTTGTTTTSNKISSVKTGDNTSLAGYAMLFMTAAYGAIKLRRKEN